MRLSAISFWIFVFSCSTLVCRGPKVAETQLKFKLTYTTNKRRMHIRCVFWSTEKNSLNYNALFNYLLLCLTHLLRPLFTINTQSTNRLHLPRITCIINMATIFFMKSMFKLSRNAKLTSFYGSIIANTLTLFLAWFLFCQKLNGILLSHLDLLT